MTKPRRLLALVAGTTLLTGSVLMLRLAGHDPLLNACGGVWLFLGLLSAGMALAPWGDVP